MRALSAAPRRNRVAAGLVVIVAVTLASRLLVSSRWPFAPDSIGFMLAITDFDLTLHQPHPPGNVRYVLVGWLLVTALHMDPHAAYVLFSAAASSLAVVAVFFIGRELFGSSTGLWAALITAASPLSWFYGGVALTYAVEHLAAMVVVLACLKAWNDRRWVPMAGLAAGLAGGFRPNLAGFLLLLWLATAIRPRSVRLFAASAGAFTFAALLWLVPLAVISGGLGGYQTLVSGHAEAVMWPQSILRGHVDGLVKNLGGLGLASIWGLGAVLLVLPATALLALRGELPVSRSQMGFFAAWTLPVLAFFVLIYIGVPGHIMTVLPLAFILIGYTVSLAWPSPSGRLRLQVLLAAALVLNVMLFLAVSPLRAVDGRPWYADFANFWLLEESSPGIRRNDTLVSASVGYLRDSPHGFETVVVVGEGWPFLRPLARHITYYAPGVRVLVLPRWRVATGQTGAGPAAPVLHGDSRFFQRGEELALRNVGRLVFTGLDDAFCERLKEFGQPALRPAEGVCVVEVAGETIVPFGPYRITAAP